MIIRPNTIPETKSKILVKPTALNDNLNSIVDIIKPVFLINCEYLSVYWKDTSKINTSTKIKSGLGLGIFIGKNLLEKNFALVNCKNSKTRSGAEVNIKWKSKDLLKI